LIATGALAALMQISTPRARPATVTSSPSNRAVTAMEAKRARSGLCWLGATGLALAAYLLVLRAIDISTGPGWSLPGFALLFLAAVALGAMASLISLAFTIEHRRNERA
jgi:hypothetical protein